MKKILVILILSFYLGCTNTDYEPRTVHKTTAAGAAVGAGLGAIAGHEAGNTGTGLALGTIAGAGVGAYVGDQFEQDEQTIQEQQEVINRQNKQIDMQQAELDELRQMSHDSISYNNDTSVTGSSLGSPYGSSASSSGSYTGSYRQMQQERMNSPKAAYNWEQDTTPGYGQPMQPQTMQPKTIESYPNNSYEQPAMEKPMAKQAMPAEPHSPTHETAMQPEIVSQPFPPAQKFTSTECTEAKQEEQQAQASDAVAEKLYHYRRALRLCPENPSFHTGLSQVYIELERYDDARYELEEALKLDPNYMPARQMMAKLQ